MHVSRVAGSGLLALRLFTGAVVPALPTRLIKDMLSSSQKLRLCAEEKHTPCMLCDVCCAVMRRPRGGPGRTVVLRDHCAKGRQSWQVSEHVNNNALQSVADRRSGGGEHAHLRDAESVVALSLMRDVLHARLAWIWQMDQDECVTNTRSERIIIIEIK